MTEEQLTKSLEEALEPVHEAHQEFLKTMMDCVHNAFQVGVEVGKNITSDK